MKEESDAGVYGVTDVPVTDRQVVRSEHLGSFQRHFLTQTATSRPVIPPLLTPLRPPKKNLLGNKFKIRGVVIMG